MKKNILFLSMLLFSVMTQAQEKVKRSDRKQGAEIARELALTDAQKQQMKIWNAEKRKKMEALDKDDQILMKDYRLKKAAIQKESKEKFQGMLTPEQKQKLENIKRDRRENAAVKSRERLEKMKKDLALSDQQYKDISKLREGMTAKMKSVRENESLSIEQKQKEVKEIRRNQQKEMLAVLNESQAAQWKELKKKEREQKRAKSK
jgi:hypothetical protein